MTEIAFPILVPEHPNDLALIEMAREMELEPAFLLAQLQEWKEEEEGVQGAGWISDGRKWLELKHCTWVFRLIYGYSLPTKLDRPFKTVKLALEYPVPIPTTDEEAALLEMAGAIGMPPAELRAQLNIWRDTEDHSSRFGLCTRSYRQLILKGSEWEFCLNWWFAPDGTIDKPCRITEVFGVYTPPPNWKVKDE